MFGLLAGLHALLFRGVFWLLKLPLQALLSFVLAVLALLGEEVRRWLSVLMAGLMILGVSWVLLKVAARQQFVLLLVMLLGLLWLRAVFVAAHMTARNRLIAVRQRQAFRELRGEVGQLGGRLEGLRGDLGRRARGTPLEGAWRSNRERRAEEAAAAEEAANERWQQRQAKEHRDRWAEQVGREHDPFQRQGS